MDYLTEILFTRIYLGEKFKCAIFPKERKKKNTYNIKQYKSINWRCFWFNKIWFNH